MSSYEIKRGDTLGALAKRFGTTVRELARVNKISNPDRIKAGAKIIVPTKEPMEEQVRRVMGGRRRPKPEPKAAAKPEKKGITFSLFSKAAAAEKPRPSIMEKPKEKQRSEPLVPTNIRQLFFDVFGGESTVTEDNLKSEELEALKSAVKTAKARGSSAIEYEDYGTQAKGESQYAGVGGGGSMLGKIADPAYSMKTFIGQGGITQNEKGETIVLDRYNFNDAVDGNLFDYLKDVKKAGLSFYGQARALGRHFGSAPGEGSPVAINLGRIDV